MIAEYGDTVRLLMDVMPATFRSPHFAMKGGTAINLFVLDMPRLSVDIDLAYTRLGVSRKVALDEIAGALATLAADLKHEGMQARLVPAGADPDSKVVVTRKRRTVTVEVNTLFRGTILPTEARDLAPAAQAEFKRAQRVTTLSRSELYGGKVVAALDRQHPRDLFDVQQLFLTTGVTSEVRRCFVLYLAGHNRPPQEVIDPRRKDIEALYENDFRGMAEHDVPLAGLLEVRERLIKLIQDELSEDERRFLVSLVRGEPDWAIAGAAHASQLPAIQWKVQNIQKLAQHDKTKHRQAVEAVTRCLNL